MQPNLKKYGSCFWLLSNMLFLSLAMLCSLGTMAQSNPQKLWQKANHYYQQKQYDSAAALYLQLKNEGYNSPALYYNLGNTYYRLHESGSAVLYFEKALKADPGNRKVADNLALAQNQIHNPLTQAAPIFFIRWWNGFVAFLPPVFWAVFTFAVFILLLCFLYFQATGRKPLHAGRWLSLIVVVLSGSALVFYVSWQRHNRNNKAVVMKEDAALYHEASASGTSISVPEGTTVLIGAEKDGYYYVELPNGANGWMARKVIEKVAGN